MHALRPATRRSTFGALLVGVALGAAPVRSAAQTEPSPVRVAFAAGASSATLRGVVGGDEPLARFVLRARAGQRMRVSLRGASGVRVEVLAPDGRRGSPWSMGAAEPGDGWEARLLESGDHILTVTGGGTSAPFTLTVAVEDGDRDAAEPPPAGEYVGDDGGRVELTPAAGGAIRFALHAIWRGPRPFYREGVVHIGEAEGTLRPRGHVARWRHEDSPDCTLVFRLDDGRVYVQQLGTAADCGFGTNVRAEGVYVRRPSRVTASGRLGRRSDVAPRPSAARAPPSRRPA